MHRERPGEVPPALFAFLARDPDYLGLGINLSEGICQFRRVPVAGKLLLMVQQRQHFTILLQLLPEGFYQILN